MKILFIGAHTDDIELGCGGTIARMKEEGHEISCLILSDCGRIGLGEECYSSFESLGITNVVTLSFAAREFPRYRQDILDTLIRQRTDIKPDQIFTHSQFDRHQDHRQVGLESLRAFRTVPSIFTYTHAHNRITGQDDMYVRLNDRHMDAKVMALSKYESQIERDYIRPNYVLTLGWMIGARVGLDFAESFEVVKQTI